MAIAFVQAPPAVKSTATFQQLAFGSNNTAGNFLLSDNVGSQLPVLKLTFGSFSFSLGNGFDADVGLS